MSSLITYDAFEGRLQNGRAGTILANVPLVFENEFAQSLIDQNVGAFIYVEIYGDSYDQETVGATGQNMWLERGITYMHVMTPAGGGSRLGRQYADALLLLFREQPIGELFMLQMSIGSGQPGQDLPNYYSIAATIRWYRRDITQLP